MAMDKTRTEHQSKSQAQESTPATADRPTNGSDRGDGDSAQLSAGESSSDEVERERSASGSTGSRRSTEKPVVSEFLDPTQAAILALDALSPVIDGYLTSEPALDKLLEHTRPTDRTELWAFKRSMEQVRKAYDSLEKRSQAGA